MGSMNGGCQACRSRRRCEAQQQLPAPSQDTDVPTQAEAQTPLCIHCSSCTVPYIIHAVYYTSRRPGQLPSGMLLLKRDVHGPVANQTCQVPPCRFPPGIRSPACAVPPLPKYRRNPAVLSCRLVRTFSPNFTVSPSQRRTTYSPVHITSAILALLRHCARVQVAGREKRLSTTRNKDNLPYGLHISCRPLLSLLTALAAQLLGVQARKATSPATSN